MNTRLRSFLQLIVAGVAFSGVAAAQTPLITGPLTSSLSNQFSPTKPNAVTAGAQLPSGFALYIPGNFNPNQFDSVHWVNTQTGFDTFLFEGNIRSFSNSLIVVNVPGNIPGFFGNPVSGPQQVNITVREFIPSSESSVESNAAAFFINPPPVGLAVTQSITAGQSFSAPIVSGGTPPYAASLTSGSSPPGLVFSSSGTIGGVPTTPGLYSFVAGITDTWGVPASSSDLIQVVGQPTISQINPSIAVAGSAAVQITITGTNFVAPVTAGGPSGQVIFPGTTARWTVGTSRTPLATQVLSSTQMTATVPASLLTTALTALIDVVQPSGAGSNSLPFTVVGQLSITTATLPSGTQGVAYSSPVATSGGASPFTWTAQGLPPGLTIGTTNGTISGTPTQFGNFSVTASVVDALGQTSSRTIPLTINPPPFSITTTSLPPAVVTVPYSVTVTSTGGVAPLAWSAQGLPTGLSIVPSTGTIAGTPTVNGSFTVTVTASDSLNRSASRQYSLVVSLPVLTIATTALPPGTMGSPYSTTLAATGGVPPLTWSAAGLPAGLTIDSSTGVIAGTPTTNGNFTVTVRVVDSADQSASQQYSLVVGLPVLTIATTALPPGTLGTPYSANLAGAGGVPPFAWSAAGLPAGLTINSSTGVVAGTPTANGNFTVTVTLRDSADQSVNRQFGLTIGLPVLSITTSSLPPATQGVAYAATLAGSGGVPPFVWTAQGLPNGLTVNSGTGLISGTPIPFGPFDVTVTLSDAANQSTSRQFTLTVAPRPLTIATASLAAGQQGTAYVGLVTAGGGVSPFTWSAAQLPPGLVINSLTGQITGTPTATGTFPARFTVVDAAQQTASATIPIVIAAPGPPPLQITGSGTLLPGTVGVPYATAIAINGGAPGYVVTLAGGSLPPGLNLIPEGAISGIPTTAGTFRFTLRATDTASATDTKDYTLVINPAPLTVTGTVQDVPRDSPVSVRFGATGGVPPYTFTATGALPIGTTFSNGLLSGTATTSGAFQFAVTVTDSTGATASRSFTINVTGPGLTLTGTFPNGQVGTPYQTGFSVTGGTAPYTFSFTGLPAGLSANGSSISGTPTAAGTSTVTVKVTDNSGLTTSQTFSVVIGIGPLQVTTTSLPAAVSNSAYTFTLLASGGVPPYTWTVSGLPSPLAASAAGVISGTAGAPGTFTVNATVTDSRGATTTRPLTLTIGQPALTIVTTSVPSGTVGTPVSVTFAASGGTPPYTWSAAGLPAGLTLSSAGVLSGIPTGSGTTSFSVAITDNAGGSANRQFSFTAALPAAPTLTLTGLPATSTPTSQPRLTVGIGGAFPAPVTVDLTLTFTADTGPDDPTVQFAGGGRTARVTIPAGSTAALNDVGVQIGTVAGTATITARFSASGQDLTPSPAPTRTIRINAGPPVITAVTATRSGSTFTVNITGYAVTRSVTTANFTFTAATGTTLQTTQLSVPVDAIFAPYFQSAAGAALGSQFTFSQPFTLNGTGQVASVSVTLVNAAGTSNSMTATVP